MNNIIGKYFDESITDEELAALKVWLDESPGNRREFVAMYRAWNLSGFDLRSEGLDVEKELGIFRENIRRKSIRLRTRRLCIIISSAAACLILALLAVNRGWFESPSSGGIMSYVNGGGAGVTELSVPHGKRSEVALPDGTTVRASAGTRLVYPEKFGKKTREIFVDGQIYLDVARDAGWPFIVRTWDMDVTVLGTKFMVTAYGDRPVDDVVLVEGSVSVSNRETGTTTLLAPDRMYVYDETSGNEDVKDVDTSVHTSWMNGRYKFHRETLENVLARLAEWYGVTVDCRPEAGEYLCSGTLNLNDGFDAVLGGLANVVPIEYSEEDGTYRIELLK